MIVHIPIEHSTVQSPSDTYKIMKIVLENENETDRNKEHFWTLAMNEAKNILNLELVSLGTYNMVHASPADILSIPLQKQAQGIILIHNHPLGSLQPSEEDKNFTDLMIQACRIMKMHVIDHLIINEHSYFSFTETGLLDRLEGSNKYIPPYELEKMSFQGGWEEGLEEGEKKGIEKGIKARNLEIAKHMLSKGVDMQFICEMTGLNKTKVNALK